MAVGWRPVLLLLTLLVFSLCSCTLAAELEGLFEEQEPAAPPSPRRAPDAGGAPASTPHIASQPASAVHEPPPVGDTDSSTDAAPPSRYRALSPTEIIGLVLFVLYGLNVLRGRSVNAKLAEQWRAALVTAEGEGSVYRRNFAHLGPSPVSDPTGALTKVGNDTFELYATGRRNVSSVMTTLKLRPRQDVLLSAYDLLRPSEDTVELHMELNDAAAPPTVMAVATPRLARAMAKDCPDIADYCKPLTVTAAKLPGWPSPYKAAAGPGAARELHVLAEQSAVWYEIFGDGGVLRALGSDAARKHFRYAHLSSEWRADEKDKPHKVLRFAFALPSDPAGLSEVAQLVALALHLVDVVGAYRMPPDVAKRATDNRNKQAEQAFKKAEEARQEALQAKKLDKLQAEKDRLARMTPEARAKYEEKQARKQKSRQMKARMIRA